MPKRDKANQLNPSKQTKRYFPQCQAVFVHQNGLQLTTPSDGIEIILHTRENERNPCCAEIISEDHYAEISLSFVGMELSDFDGVFFLPQEVGEMLCDAGYVVSKNCYA